MVDLCSGVSALVVLSDKHNWQCGGGKPMRDPDQTVHLSLAIE